MDQVKYDYLISECGLYIVSTQIQTQPIKQEMEYLFV